MSVTWPPGIDTEKTTREFPVCSVDAGLCCVVALEASFYQRQDGRRKSCCLGGGVEER